MIRLATVFSGIGAIEHALDRMQLEHEIVFACDNGDVDILTKEIGMNVDDIGVELSELKRTISVIHDNGEVQDILTYSFDKVTNHPWTHRLVARMNEEVPPTVDDLLVPLGSKVFEFSIKQLGWSYTIKNGHYY